MKRSVLALAMGLIAITAMAKTIKTTVFTTSPQMHCENCENKIKGNLRFEKGVKKIVTDIDSQTVTVTYDADKISVDRLMKGFSKFGYTARELKPGETVTTDSDEECPNM